MRTSAWLIFVIGLIGTLFCGYSFLFWSWVTATPLSESQRSRAEFNAYCWLAFGGLGAVVTVAALIAAVRRARRAR